MDVLYVYCFKSVRSYKHKVSRIESLVILYWGINCTIYANNMDRFSISEGGKEMGSGPPWKIMWYSFQ